MMHAMSATNVRNRIGDLWKMPLLHGQIKRRSTCAPSAIISLVLCLSAGLTRSANAQLPRLYEGQASQIAMDYCAAIGQKVSFAIDTKFPYRGFGYYSDRWQVRFPEAEVVIDDATGIVTCFQSSGQGSDKPPDGKTIDEATAIQLGDKALKATGQTESLGPARAKLDVMIHARGTPAEWSIFWDRMVKGIPYKNQGAGAIIDAYTGHIDVAGVTYPSPPITKFKAIISQHAAEVLAKSYIYQSLKVTDIALEKMDEKAVIPSREIGTHSSIMDHAGEALPARVAWLVRCKYNNPDGRIGGRVVWIDVETGAILGWETTYLYNQGNGPRPGPK